MFQPDLREDVKYYFADFVRKGGGAGTPKSSTHFLQIILSVKGEGVLPISINVRKWSRNVREWS